MLTWALDGGFERNLKSNHRIYCKINEFIHLIPVKLVNTPHCDMLAGCATVNSDLLLVPCWFNIAALLQ